MAGTAGWRRILFGRLGPSRDGWPTATPPTAPGGQPPQFHCHVCRTPVATAARTCPSCGERLVED